MGCAHAVALSSCTAGLHLALEILRIGPGDEVITTPLTFSATANVIIHVGARPVFAVDVAPSRLALLPQDRSLIAVDSSREDVVEVVNRETRGRMADVVFEVTGDAQPRIVWEYVNLLEVSEQGGRVGAIPHAARIDPARLSFLGAPTS